MKLRFVSNNPEKIREINEILGKVGVSVIPCPKNFNEIQADDAESIVKDKVIKAFKEIRRPLFVEHTGLYLHKFNGFPGGLTQIVFDSLQAEKFSEFFGSVKKSAIAKTVIGYTDGKEIKIFQAETKGKISKKPRGNEYFQWDCVFIPDKSNLTFAELKERKDKYSMRRKALHKLTSYYKNKLYSQNIKDLKKLIELIRQRKVILFIGSGVSRTLGLPLYGDIIDYFAKELGYEKELFKLYGEEASLAEFYIIKKGKGKIGKFRTWMQKECDKREKKVDESRIYELIASLKCEVIYTTNYDSLLEDAHEVFAQKPNVIRNIGDLQEIKDGGTKIVKFHGDFEEDRSIVLSESKYFERMDFEDPLDIMLRHDALEKSILFLGYSLSDINLRYLLYKMNKLWGQSGYKRYRPESYIFLSKPNPIQELILEERKVKSIVSIKDNPEEGLKSFLERLVKGAFGD